MIDLLPSDTLRNRKLRIGSHYTSDSIQNLPLLSLKPSLWNVSVRTADISSTISTKYQIFTKRQKSKLNRTKLSTDLERARKTEAKGTKGLETELKRKLPD
ncbi:hypothetical protein Tco_0435997 [Tanacetum coccineum]